MFIVILVGVAELQSCRVMELRKLWKCLYHGISLVIWHLHPV
jgi:hypothetical protein